jgi:hypothetical protein
MAYNFQAIPKLINKNWFTRQITGLMATWQIQKNIFAIIDAESVPCHARSTQMR